MKLLIALVVTLTVGTLIEARTEKNKAAHSHTGAPSKMESVRSPADATSTTNQSAADRDLSRTTNADQKTTGATTDVLGADTARDIATPDKAGDATAGTREDYSGTLARREKVRKSPAEAGRKSHSVTSNVEDDPGKSGRH